MEGGGLKVEGEGWKVEGGGRLPDEVKVVFDGVHTPSTYGIEAEHYYLQPCDTGNEKKNAAILKACVDYILGHPKWKLSLQTQKIINVR